MIVGWDDLDNWSEEDIEETVNVPAKVSVQEKLEQQSQELIARVTDSDYSETKDIIGLFNAHEARRNMVRMTKLNKMFDLVTDQMLTRVEQRPDNFSNEDLLKFMKTTQDAIKQTSDMVNRVKDEPAIQITNNQLTVQVAQEEMSRESRERVTDAVKAILAHVQSPQPVATVESEVVVDNTEDELK